MGASMWSYFVPYHPDPNAALQVLKDKVFADGDYWWAARNEFSPASAFADRPTTVDELWSNESVRESGTHSILDMDRVIADSEQPDYGTVEMVTPAEAKACTGTETLTREHVEAIGDLVTRRWFGRCAILHDADGQPQELYFWGYSGD